MAHSDYSGRESVDAGKAVSPKKEYRAPKLIPLGSVRQLTGQYSGGGAADGRQFRGTKRGGDF
jgi:hypothetical protein